MLLFFSEHRAKEGVGSFIRRTCPSKPVWAGSISSRRLEADHCEMENLLSHFSTARASGLKKKPKIPHGKSANCHLKREKERVAKNSEAQDLIRATGQRQLASSVRDSCPVPRSSATTVGWGRLTQVHPWPSNPRPQLSSFCWRILATGSSCLYKGPVVNLSSLIHSFIQFILI